MTGYSVTASNSLISGTYHPRQVTEIVRLTNSQLPLWAGFLSPTRHGAIRAEEQRIVQADHPNGPALHRLFCRGRQKEWWAEIVVIIDVKVLNEFLKVFFENLHLIADERGDDLLVVCSLNQEFAGLF